VIERLVREFGGLRVDTCDWPIVLMEFPELRIADTQLQDALGYIENLMRDSEKMHTRSFQITDLTRMRELAPPSQRQYGVEWMRRTLALQRTASVGGANVTPSPLLRGLITAINWFQTPAMPTVSVATRREALVAGIELLDAAHVPIPEELRMRIRFVRG